MSVHLHLQSLAQQLARPVQLRLAGALGDPEHLRRLPVGVAIQRVQHQRIARAIGQLGDGGLDFLHLDRGLERPTRPIVRRFLGLRFRTGVALRRLLRLTFTAIRCSQVESELRVWNCGSARQALMKVSCVQSSASWTSRVMRRHRP